MNNHHRLILASGSKVRANLLRSVGVEFETQVSDFDERAYESTIASLPLALQAVELAKQKAISVSNQFEGAFVIGADQICEIGETALTKPESKEDALHQLDALSGRTHYQHSGVCIVWDSQVIWSHCETASL
ncbi:MAG: Maf family protein, partial [Rickettsiales bacterium]|nr:Maf family protein [Rickettsiales bacterium]